MSAPDAGSADVIRRLFDRHLEAGLHHGGQLAVYSDGDLVVDAAGGRTGPDGGETTADRRHLLFSCTKPYAAVCLHQLVEDGDVDYDDPVVEHWPAFADDGTAKAGVTVRQVLSHQSGLNESAFDDRPDLWGDWDEAAAAMADADLALDPGTPAYQTLTFLKPGLKPAEYRILRNYTPLFFILFMAGSVFSYEFIVKNSLRFFRQTTAAAGVTAVWGLKDTIMFVLKISSLTGILFQLPIIAAVLSRAGVITAAQMKAHRAYVAVAVLILAAVATPPDLITQVLIATPVIILYQLSIVLVARME